MCMLDEFLDVDVIELSVGAGAGWVLFELSLFACRLYLDVLLVTIAFLIAFLFSRGFRG